MTVNYSTCHWQVQEPRKPYQLEDFPIFKNASIQSTGYPPLKNEKGSGAWRKIPWINLRGYWLEQAGFSIGTAYTIEVRHKQLIFTAA